MSEIAEKACVYAALILADEKLDITADKLSALIEAAGLEVEPIWPSIFARALEGKNVVDMVSNVGSAAPVAAPSSASAAAASTTSAGAADKKEDKKKVEEKEESDDDMGFGLFD